MPGWQRIDAWEKSILAEAMITYFAAIQRGWLIVRILAENGTEKHTLTQDSIADYFGDKLDNLINHMEENEQSSGDKLQRARFYFQCLRK